jgi:hypothetical protein
MSEDDFMRVAWASFCRWAITDRDIRRQFVEETGISLDVEARSGLDALIDQATGRNEAFLKWVTLTWWGRGGVPPKLLTEWGEEKSPEVAR